MNFDLHLIFDMVVLYVLHGINAEGAYTIYIAFTSDSVNQHYLVLVTEITRFNELNVLGQLNDFDSVFLPLQIESLREQHLLDVGLLNLIPLTPKIKIGNYPLIRKYYSNSGVLYIYDLPFKFNDFGEYFELDDANVGDVILLTNSILGCMNNINSKGYVNEASIRESQLFLRVIEKYLFSHGYESKNLGVDNNTYALGYNLIFLNLFYLVVKEIFVLQGKYGVKGDVMTDKDCDLYNVLVNLKKDLFSRLDPFVRCQLQKRGIYIIQNVYVGFDTEYELSDYCKYQNQLVSTQLAIQSIPNLH
jgi:hypothetical protein